MIYKVKLVPFFVVGKFTLQKHHPNVKTDFPDRESSNAKSRWNLNSL